MGVTGWCSECTVVTRIFRDSGDLVIMTAPWCATQRIGGLPFLATVGSCSLGYYCPLNASCRDLHRAHAVPLIPFCKALSS